MSSDERDVRDALRSRADEVPMGRADEPGLLRRLAAARRRRQQARLAGAALVLILGAAVLVAADDEPPGTLVAGPGPSTTTTVEPSTTTAISTDSTVATTVPPPTPSTTVPAATSTVPTTVPRTMTLPMPLLPDDALWPALSASTTTFSTPQAAASDFAKGFLGMATVRLEAPQVSGSEATVKIHPNAGASITTVVSLRRIEFRGWIVVGCAAPSIEVAEPAAGATVTSPLTVRGRAQAFEGHVDVEVRRDGSNTPLGRSFGTGASDQLSPYEATVTFTPAARLGTVVVSEPSAEDAAKGPLAATVVRIRF